MTPEQIQDLIAREIAGWSVSAWESSTHPRKEESILAAQRVIWALADEHLSIVGGGAIAPKPEAPPDVSWVEFDEGINNVQH